MGCNADKDMRSDVPCTHRRVLECQDCRCTFAVRYTDDVIQSLLDRVKELESKLRAADRTSAVTAAKPMRPTVDATGTTAASSVSAEEWRGWARENRRDGRNRSARACDLAADITRIYESTQHLSYNYDDGRMKDFTRICLAFVRGEPLPEKSNG